jgi:hypothetical protein
MTRRHEVSTKEMMRDCKYMISHARKLIYLFFRARKAPSVTSTCVVVVQQLCCRKPLLCLFHSRTSNIIATPSSTIKKFDHSNSQTLLHAPSRPFERPENLI